MQWASSIAKRGGVREAVAEACAAIEAQLRASTPHLVLVFASAELAASGERLPELIQANFPHATVVGTSGAGVIGAGHEEEDLPALALVAAHLPGVHLAAFHVDTAQLPGRTATGSDWQTTLGVPADGRPQFIVFADPFTCDVGALLRGLDLAYPKSGKVGGLSSGGRGPGGTRLFLNGTTWRSGAVGVALKGRVRMETLVAQGCRGIGTPMLVTRCDGNRLLEVNQRRPIDVLRALHGTLPEADRELFRTSLLLGVEMKGDQVEFDGGDFLVRNIIGVDPRTGALAVAADLRPFQVVQFMVRDAGTAAADLQRRLEHYRAQRGGVRPAGALLFTCVGRGRHLFGREDHDTGLLQQILGGMPVGGFFCNGEIGPVGGATFQHGYTSAFALFSPE